MLSEFNWGQICGIFCGLCGTYLASGAIFMGIMFGFIAFLVIAVRGDKKT